MVRYLAEHGSSYLPWTLFFKERLHHPLKMGAETGIW